MPIHYDVTTDIRYKQGSDARAKKIIIKLLRQGKMTIKEIAAFVEVPVDFVIQIQNELLEQGKNAQ